MERRKFVIGMGSLAAGGAAAMGTGAVDVEARRQADFALASDENALLGLTPGETELVYLDSNGDGRDEDGTLAFDFSQIDADGFNKQAVTTIEEAFYITNNTAQELEVSIYTGNDPDAVKAVENDFLSFEAGSDDEEILNHRDQSDTTENNVVLGSGEEVAVDIVVDTKVEYGGTQPPETLLGGNNRYGLTINTEETS